MQNATDSSTKTFEGLEIKKSRVYDFLKKERNPSIRFDTSYPAAKDSSRTSKACAQFVEKWVQKGMLYMQNCVFLNDSGFYINTVCAVRELGQSLTLKKS
jgi:hypothetical protein